MDCQRGNPMYKRPLSKIILRLSCVSTWREGGRVGGGEGI